MGDGQTVRIISIATSSYRPTVDRMLRSLAAVHPDADVTVYVDDAAAFDRLPHPRTTVRLLPEIATHGVKRAKLTAYTDAASDGSFIYLDADVVILDRLDDLLDPDFGFLTACPDDLSACPFIADTEHPWPRAPELVNRRYINSGVMGFGSAMGPYLDRLREYGNDDQFWHRYIHPEGLFDNHVLCAFLNLEEVPLRQVSERMFNWQGLRRTDGSCCARLVAGTLQNVDTGERLHLVHFAGVRDIDRALLDLPLEVGRYIQSASVEGLDAAAAASRIQAAPQGIDRRPGDHRRVTIAGLLTKASVDAWDGDGPWASSRYVSQVDPILSALLSVPPTDVMWNGLPCGGEYLEPSEYLAVRSIVSRAQPQTVVSFGAPETSRLLANLTPRLVVLQPADEEWIERPTIAPAGAPTGAIGPDGSIDASASIRIPPEVDLLFVDSPNDCAKRLALLDRFVTLSMPTRIIVRDSRRDLDAVGAVLAGLDYVFEENVQSFRGLAVLRRATSPALAKAPNATPLTVWTAQLNVLEADLRLGSSLEGEVLVRIENTSSATWPSFGAAPVRVSYHLQHVDQTLVFDGVRTDLPCDLEPGDVIEVPVTIRLPRPIVPSDGGAIEGIVTLVQDGVAWFDDVDANCSSSVRITVQPAD